MAEAQSACFIQIGDVHGDRHGVRVPVGVGGDDGQGVDRLRFVVQRRAGGHRNLAGGGFNNEAVVPGDGVGDLVAVGVGGGNRVAHGCSAG